MDDFKLAKPTSEPSFNIATLNLAENNPYVVVAKTGVTVTPFPFERLKFDQSRLARFSILTSEVVVVKRHYHESLGYFLCNGRECCRLTEKSPSVVYLYPIVHYTDCSDKGKPLSDRVQVKMLHCNKDMYNYLCNIQEIKGDLTNFDFLGKIQDGSDKFPKTQLMEAWPCLWKNEPSNLDYIQDYMKQNGDRFLSSVGKIYTDEKLRELLDVSGSSQSALPADTNLADLDEVFK